MHPHLVGISNLWQADVACDTLRAEHAGLTSAVVTAQQALAAAVTARDQAHAALDAARAEDRKTNRELEDYTKKRDTTRKMIEGGTAPDYAAAERQLAQCLAILDRIETQALEGMDRVAAAEAHARNAGKAHDAATAALAEARKALAARDAPLRSELTAALAVRDARAKELHEDYRVPYGELRRKKRVALVNTVNDICSVCNMKVPAQKVNEVFAGTGVHACPGCGGYVLPATG